MFHKGSTCCIMEVDCQSCAQNTLPEFPLYAKPHAEICEVVHTEGPWGQITE